MRNECLFRDRLREHFGERCDEFSEHLAGIFREFWTDGVQVGKCWPDPYAHDGMNRRLRIMEHFGPRCHEFSGNLRGLLVELWKDALDYGRGEMCAHCGSREQVTLEDARTQYCETEENPDPNADIPYCRSCAEEHHEHWDEMWDEYNAGRG